jgi:hypothetical protein
MISARKQAARTNGKRGGRPKNPPCPDCKVTMMPVRQPGPIGLKSTYVHKRGFACPRCLSVWLP